MNELGFNYQHFKTSHYNILFYFAHPIIEYILFVLYCETKRGH